MVCYTSICHGYFHLSYECDASFHLQFISDGKLQKFPVALISPEQIVDTNGAGDSFVGGQIKLAINSKIMICFYSPYCTVFAIFVFTNQVSLCSTFKKNQLKNVWTVVTILPGKSYKCLVSLQQENQITTNKLIFFSTHK